MEAIADTAHGVIDLGDVGPPATEAAASPASAAAEEAAESASEDDGLRAHAVKALDAIRKLHTGIDDVKAKAQTMLLGSGTSNSCLQTLSMLDRVQDWEVPSPWDYHTPDQQHLGIITPQTTHTLRLPHPRPLTPIHLQDSAPVHVLARLGSATARLGSAMASIAWGWGLPIALCTCVPNINSEDIHRETEASLTRVIAFTHPFVAETGAGDEAGLDEAGDDEAGLQAGDEVGNEEFVAGDEAGDQAGDDLQPIEGVSEEAGLDEAGNDNASLQAGDDLQSDEAGDDAGDEAGDQADDGEAGNAEADDGEAGDDDTVPADTLTAELLATAGHFHPDSEPDWMKGIFTPNAHTELENNKDEGDIPPTQSSGDEFWAAMGYIEDIEHVNLGFPSTGMGSGSSSTGADAEHGTDCELAGADAEAGADGEAGAEGERVAEGITGTGAEDFQCKNYTMATFDNSSDNMRDATTNISSDISSSSHSTSTADVST
jgi:hypothetical protein